MWLLWTSLALAGTLTLNTDEQVEFTVSGASVVADGKATEVSGMSAGAHSLQVSRGGSIVWAGELRLPSDDVDATLKWKKGGLTLDDVSYKKTAAEKLKTAGNVATGVAAGAQQAAALSNDVSAARSDFDKAQSGELTESSHTEMSMEIGPGGVSSSSSRTTAGASGVEHSSTSSNISRDGSSLSRTDASLNSSGYQERSTDKSLRMPAGERGDVLLIGGPVKAGETLTAVAPPEAVAVSGGSAAAAPPPPIVELAEEFHYEEPASATTGDVEVQFFDPISNAGMAKVALKIANDGTAPVTFTEGGGSFDVAGTPRSPGGRKAGQLVVVLPGDLKKRTFNVDGAINGDTGYRVDPLGFTLSGITSYDIGELTGAADSALATEEFSGGGATCSLGKFKEKKGTLTASWKCEATGGPVFVDPSALSITDGNGTVAPERSFTRLLVAGDTERIEVSWGLDGTVAKAVPDTLVVSWSAAVKQAKPTELAAVSTSFKAKPPE